jgi:hypothetical protein
MTDDQPIPPAPQTENDSHNDAAHPDSNAVSEMKTPPSNASYKITCEKKRDKWDVAKLVAEFIGLAFLILYTLYTAGIYCANQRAAQAAHDTFVEIQKQTTLMRQQLVGTQAAVIIFGDEPRWNATKQNLTFQLANTGSVVGKVTTFDATVQRRSLPDETPVGPPVRIQISNTEIMKGATYPIVKGLPWVLPEVKNVSDWPGKEIVTVNGSYTYDNGFSEFITHKFCFLWVAQWGLHMPPPSGAGWGGGGWGWGMGKEPCRTVEEMRNEFTGTRQHIKDASTPQH